MTYSSITEERFRRAIQSINDAAFDLGCWQSALNDIAELCGCSSAQLVAAEKRSEIRQEHVLLLETIGQPPGTGAELVARGGLTVKGNPRVAAGMHSPILSDLAELDFVDEEELARSALYQEFFLPTESYHTVQAKVVEWDGNAAGVSVFRARKLGPVQEPERENFRRVLLHARASIVFRFRLEEEALAIGTGMFDTIGAAIVLCDPHGSILRVSLAAEALLRGGTAFRTRNNKLEIPAAAAQLSRSLFLAAYGRPVSGPVPSALVVADDMKRYRVEIRPYLRKNEAMLIARPVVVAIFEAKPTSDAVLRKMGLSAAEAAVASRLIDGDSPAKIATERNARLNTVRSQIKSVYAKLNVRRQSELAAMLRHLL